MYAESGNIECRLAGSLGKNLDSVRKLGCSDCGCGSHLFFCADFKTLGAAVREAFRGHHIREYIFS